MKKRCLFLICLALLLFSLPVHGRGQTPEEFVREFYLWYGAGYLSDDTSYLFGETIYKYVAPCTVERLRIDMERGTIDYDYFLSGQDFWQELLDNLKVYDHIRVNDTISIVPVGFGDGNNYRGEPHLLVFVKEEKGRLFIIKVADIIPDQLY